MSDLKSHVRLIGLSEIQMCDVRSGGEYPTTAASFSTIGNVVPDSCHFVIEQPAVTDIYVEEEDTPDLTIFGTRKLFLEFAVRDMGTKTLIKAFGGVAVTTLYSFPTTTNVYTEQAIKATGKTINGKKVQVEIPRASVVGGGDLKFARTDTGTLTFTCSVLLPASSGVIPPVQIRQV